MEPKLTLSVHQLVDFLLRQGDIDNRIYNKSSMSEGTRIHAAFQKKQGQHYLSEYDLQETFEVDHFEVTLQGRADGIILLPNRVIIDEIKSTVIDLDEFANMQEEWHRGQAECYALMYAHEKGLTSIDVRLTYISQSTESQKVREFHYTVVELEQRITALIREYLNFYRFLYEKRIRRNESAKSLTFPFPQFREGQKQLARYCYAAAKQKKILFAEAPTGIGKTISTLYPLVHYFAEEQMDKIFYLTAKTSGREAAYSTVLLLKEHGFVGSVIQIVAKEKICFQKGAVCNPDECPFAKDYYQKIQGVLHEALISEECFDPNTIIDLAEAHQICPFELELDLSLFVDIIICDYNYVFDPMVYMRRYFDEDASQLVALIDEAHNLVDRGREMFTAEISTSSFEAARRILTKSDHKKMKNALKRMRKLWNEFRQDLEEGETRILSDLDPLTMRILDQFVKAGQDWLKETSGPVDKLVMDFYFEVNRFLKIYELFDDSFSLYLKRQGKEMVLTLFCIDPSRHLRRRMVSLRSAILFSATFSPSDYFLSMLGGHSDDPWLSLPSPFPREQLLLLVHPGISTRLKNREETLNDLVDAIATFVQSHQGNYLVFFPSYVYMEEVYHRYLEREDHQQSLMQKREMSEDERHDFLQQFTPNPTETLVGFAVLGGAFSEGIDLMDDRLIGAVIVGVGLPTPTFERNLIKEYFDAKENKGYQHAYVHPGMNRVMQAAGRVIRSEKDQGMILLIDDRFLHRQYRVLFKNEWEHYEVVTTSQEIEDLTKAFWKR